MPSRTPDAVQAGILEDYAAYMPGKNICRKWGIKSIRTVYNIVRRHNRSLNGEFRIKRALPVAADWTWREGALLERLHGGMPIKKAAEYSGLTVQAAQTVAAREKRLGRI